MKLTIRLLIIVIVSFFEILPIFADIKDARESYNNGDSDRALAQYDDWLNLNRNSDKFTSVLLEISELEGDSDKICTLLEKQVKFVKPGSQKILIYERIAQLYDLGSHLNKAQLAYQNAALGNLDSVNYKNLLQSSLLLIMEGNMLLAESQLKEVITNSPDSQISSLANQYYAIIKYLSSLPEKDLSTNNNSSESLYLAYLIAMVNNDKQTVADLKSQISKKYPNSPNTKLITGKIDALPNIITSFGLLNTEITGIELGNRDKPQIHSNFNIQVGSFKDPENAHFLSVDIKKYNFSPIVEEQIVNNIKYYKVLLYYEDEAGMIKALSELKQKGFDGFPIY